MRAPPRPSAVHEPPARRVRLQALGLAAVAASVVYLVWRATSTIDGDAPVLSWLFLGLEAYGVVSLALFVHATWDLGAMGAPDPVFATRHRIAVLITTCNEDRDTLLPTVAAAVALEPHHETWVLDDGNRPWVRELATGLGARYLSRTERTHAKAGNLNHALAHLAGADDPVELVAVLDADHVPLPGFLVETIGYFDRHPDVAVVQTPQDFYNTDSFEHAGGLSEESLFYRVLQPGKNRWNAAFWCGTSAVLRVSALRTVGGVATDSVTEDIHTSIRLHRAGWRTVFHDTVLAQGLAPPSYREFRLQRERWAAGAMRILRSENPLAARDLTWSQRLAYGFSLGGWFESWRSLGYLLVPVVVLSTGQFPVAAPPEVFLPAFAAVFALHQATFHALGRGHTHPWHSLVFDVLRMPGNLVATLRLFAPDVGTFAVTPKGRTGTRRRIASVPPLLVAVLGLQVLALGWFTASMLGRTATTYGSRAAAALVAVIACAQAVLLVAAVARIRRREFGAERRSGRRMATSLPARLNGHPCELVSIGFGGGMLRPDAAGLAVIDGPVFLELPLPPEGFSLQLAPVRVERTDERGEVAFTFAEGQWSERAHLARLLMWLPDRFAPGPGTVGADAATTIPVEPAVPVVPVEPAVPVVPVEPAVPWTAELVEAGPADPWAR